MKLRLMLCLGVLALPTVAVAAGKPGFTAPEREYLTDSWLEVQREGLEASRHVQQATPAERERSMQRWLDSYEYAIPDFYTGEEAGDYSTD